MNQDGYSVQQGTITSFDAYSGKGEVQVDNRSVPFDETCFRSGRPIRPPRLGERVDVIFTSDRSLLSLRSRN